MAGRPKTRAKREQLAKLNGYRPKRRPSAIDHLEALYSEEYDTFDALRAAMVQRGIVDHGINPYDVIQRAIDDTSMDYMLIRRIIDRDTHGDANKLPNHPLYDFHEHVREAMVRYSTFAMQYDIQKRQLKLSESRVALLSVTLRTVLTQLGLNQDQIKRAPQLLIQAIQSQEPPEGDHNPRSAIKPRLDPLKAEALAEILGNEAEIVITDAEDIP